MIPQVSNPPVRVALIDLYNGEPNQGIRAITELIHSFKHPALSGPMLIDRFETRLNEDIPGLDYDIYLLSGGPGSPFEGIDQSWEAKYFNLVDAIWNHNARQQDPEGRNRKFALFICHSFQMMCRHFEFGTVTQRQLESFGIFKTHQTKAGAEDPLFARLSDPFYATDIRKWQVVQPNHRALEELGSEIIALEKERQDSSWERALMGIRVSPEIAGVQFHPEADPDGMLVHFQDEKRKTAIVEKYGEDRYQMIIERLQKPEYLEHTYETIIPNFLGQASSALRGTD